LLAYSALLALSLVWFAGSGLFGPKLLNLLPKRMHPRFRILFWLGGLYSLGFSALTAMACAGIMLAFSWNGLDQADRGLSDLWYIVLVSILPYAAFAGLGIAAALVILRLQPAREAARETSQLLKLTSRPHADFQGLPVRMLDAGFLAAALVELDRRPTILITRQALQDLTEVEIHAVYWHELGHAVGEHNGLNRIARIAGALAPGLPLTRALPEAIRSNCEEWADVFALAKADPAALASARSKFAF
jgi:Zn-dependent protease with chaperone function